MSQLLTHSTHSPGAGRRRPLPLTPCAVLRLLLLPTVFNGLLKALARLLKATLVAVPLVAAAQAEVVAEPYPVPDAQSSTRALELQAHTSPVDLGGVSRYWVGPNTNAGVDQIAQRASAGGNTSLVFKPYSGTGVQIIDNQVLWITFDAVNRSPGARWFLELGLPAVDDASLFWQNDAGQWTEQRAGDALVHSQWPIASRNPVFALSNQTQAPVRYYLRVLHQRAPFAAPLRIHNAAGLLGQRELEHLLLGCFFGLTLLTVVIGLVNGYTQRENTFGIYALYVLVLVLGQLVSTGVGAQRLWPNALGWRAMADFLMPVLSLAAGVWLLRTTISHNRPWPVPDAALLGVTWVALSVALVDAFWPSTWGFLLSNSAALVALVLVLAVLWRALQTDDNHTRWLAVGFAPVMLGSLLPVLGSLGIVPSGFLTQSATMIGMAVSAPVLLVALFARSAQRRVNRARTAALMQTDPLTGLNNDRALAQNLHGSLMRSQRSNHQFGLLLIELSNLDWFNHTHGRLVGDRAVLLTSTRLAGVARNVDTVARLQDNLFVLLMDGPVTPAQVTAAAGQIVARTLRPSDQLPVGASLKVRVTAALLPDAQLEHWGEDANACLNWLMSQSATDDTGTAKSIRHVNF